MRSEHREAVRIESALEVRGQSRHAPRRCWTRHRSLPLKFHELLPEDCLELFELSLFEFYLSENAATIEGMLSAERAYVDEQQRHGVELVNDSGIVAAEHCAIDRRWQGVLERVMGIEPTLVAWEATVLPLNYTRAVSGF